MALRWPSMDKSPYLFAISTYRHKLSVGAAVGVPVGDSVGDGVGAGVGSEVGECVGTAAASASTCETSDGVGGAGVGAGKGHVRCQTFKGATAKAAQHRHTVRRRLRWCLRDHCCTLVLSDGRGGPLPYRAIFALLVHCCAVLIRWARIASCASIPILVLPLLARHTRIGGVFELSLCAVCARCPGRRRDRPRDTIRAQLVSFRLLVSPLQHNASQVDGKLLSRRLTEGHNLQVPCVRSPTCPALQDEVVVHLKPISIVTFDFWRSLL
jgi:hypothetical protein